MFVVSLVAIPAFWGVLCVLAEAFRYWDDRQTAKRLYSKFGRDIYEGPPLKKRIRGIFRNQFRKAFWTMAVINGALLLLLWWSDS